MTLEYFKYLNPERIDVLKNLKIRYTQACALNDPFESFPGIIQRDKEWYKKAFMRNIESEAKDQNFRSDVKRKQYIRARKKDFDNFYKCYSDEKWLFERTQEVILLDSSIQGYLSLSATEKNILMWSHYAQNHEGFIIGFNSEHEYFDYGLEKITYSEKRPFLDPTQSQQDASLFTTKSTDWAYEQEYRKSHEFVERIQLDDGGSFLPFPDSTPNPLDESLTKVRLFSYPRSVISSVILGWKSDARLEHDVLSALGLHNIKGVKICKSRPHKYKYEMEIIQINET